MKIWPISALYLGARYSFVPIKTPVRMCGPLGAFHLRLMELKLKLILAPHIEFILHSSRAGPNNNCYCCQLIHVRRRQRHSASQPDARYAAPPRLTCSREARARAPLGPPLGAARLCAHARRRLSPLARPRERAPSVWLAVGGAESIAGATNGPGRRLEPALHHVKKCAHFRLARAECLSSGGLSRTKSGPNLVWPAEPTDTECARWAGSEWPFVEWRKITSRVAPRHVCERTTYPRTHTRARRATQRAGARGATCARQAP